MKRKTAILCAAAALCAGYIIYENGAVGVSRVEFGTPVLPESFDGFKICQLSDIHVKAVGQGYSQIIRKTAAESPDAIFITGDLIDSRVSDFTSAESLINTLRDIAPVYFVTGNHEERLSPDLYIKTLGGISAAGAIVLDGRSVMISRGGDIINIIGMPDTPEPDFSAISSLTIPGAMNIMLIHRPQFASEYASAGVDLTFSGHAHGGQARIPFVGGIIAPDQMFFPDFYQGIYSFGSRATIVSRGLGNSLIPVRINNRPEIVSVTLRRQYNA